MFFWVKNTNHVYSLTAFFRFFWRGGGGVFSPTFLIGGGVFLGGKMRFAPHFFDWGATAPPPLPAPMYTVPLEQWCQILSLITGTEEARLKKLVCIIYSVEYYVLTLMI